MRKAKENVEKHYAVVGLLEDLNKTLTVLEHYVPRFFKGALKTYWGEDIMGALIQSHEKSESLRSEV